MIHGLCRFYRSHNGSITVEFSVLFILFFMSILSIAEISRLFYLSAKIDLAVSESAKTAKNTQAQNSDQYKKIFENALLKENSLFGPLLGKKNKADITVDFSTTISDFIADIRDKNGNKKSLARYHLVYPYQPVFFPFPKYWGNTLLIREVIFVQEYERSIFDN